ncbi:Hypp7126 [Branchiostoma lanceolatum]|uniref:Hypp7126 protein n=1 Tax=Branchiostoma lanceolatum TaxID=7740 RepID=A0A8K0E9E7_BRALA|nr:Hypp7126 [Branchiostoma lanceolatum]
MPFDFEGSSGTWKVMKTSDNYPQVMQKLGMSPGNLEKLMQIGVWSEVKDLGDKYSFKSKMMGLEMDNTFKLGEECEQTDFAGTKRKVTFTVEGDDLVAVYPNFDGQGLHVRQTRTRTDQNTMRMTFKIGELVGWNEAKKM